MNLFKPHLRLGVAYQRSDFQGLFPAAMAEEYLTWLPAVFWILAFATYCFIINPDLSENRQTPGLSLIFPHVIAGFFKFIGSEL